MMLLLLSWVFANTAFAAAPACAFTAEARLALARPAGPGRLALVESNGRCLYLVDSTGPALLWSAPLPGLPSDLAWHETSGKLFLFFPAFGELRSWDAATGKEAAETKLEQREECRRQRQGDITVENCQSAAAALPYRILLSENALLLSAGGQLLASPIGQWKFRSLAPFAWNFVTEVQLSPSGRLLALQNQPAGESLVNWYVLNHDLRLLSPLPAPTLYHSGVRHAYFLSGGEAILLDKGLVYRTADFAFAGDLVQPFDEAFPTGKFLVTIRAEEKGIWKATVLAESLRPVATEHFFQRPLLATESGRPGFLTYVLPEGSLAETVQTLPLRSSVHE